MTENRRIIKEQEREIEGWRVRVAESEAEWEEKTVGWSAKSQEMRENMSQVMEEKNKVIRENENIKERVMRLQEEVKRNFGEQQARVEELTANNHQLKGAVKQVGAERDNYRKLYENGVR